MNNLRQEIVVHLTYNSMPEQKGGRSAHSAVSATCESRQISETQPFTTRSSRQQARLDPTELDRMVIIEGIKGHVLASGEIVETYVPNEKADSVLNRS